MHRRAVLLPRQAVLLPGRAVLLQNRAVLVLSREVLLPMTRLQKPAAGKPADSPEDAKEPSEPSSVEKAKGKRGRPAKDLALVVSEMCSSFGTDDKTNCLFGGSEVDTQVKSIDKTLRLLKNARKGADPGMKRLLRRSM